MKLHYVHRVASAALDRSHIETEDIFSLVSTANVEKGVAVRLVTFHGGITSLLAQFAYWLKPLWWNETHTFGIIQQLCIAKFDLLRPQGTGDMHPIVPSCSLEGLSRVDGATCSFLLHSPTATGFLDDFALDAFLLTVPLGFLFMRRL